MTLYIQEYEAAYGFEATAQFPDDDPADAPAGGVSVDDDDVPVVDSVEKTVGDLEKSGVA
eukprot:gene12777-10708_t